MYLIVGLGNPEPEYAKTRHNMGFDTVNSIAKTHNIQITKNKFNALFGTGSINNEKVVLVKPQTYMNLSGEAVKAFADFYKLDSKNIIVIYDDIDTIPEKIRIRKSGGPGTHNGMKSVVQNLNSEDFLRVRVGIGVPEFKNDLINYVIGSVPNEEYTKLEEGISLAAKAVEEILQNGVDIAMNKYN